MELYKNEIYEAFSFLIRCGLTWILYFICKRFVKDSLKSNLKLYIQTVFIILVISIYQGSNTGTSIEENDDDPLYGHSERVVDYVASNQQKIGNGIHTFILLIVPSLIGVYQGIKLRD